MADPRESSIDDDGSDDRSPPVGPRENLLDDNGSDDRSPRDGSLKRKYVAELGDASSVSDLVGRGSKGLAAMDDVGSLVGSMKRKYVAELGCAASMSELVSGGKGLVALSLASGNPKLEAFPPKLLYNALMLGSSLVSLDVSRNEIKILPLQIGCLVSLEMFDFSRNFIRELPAQVLSKMQQIRLIDASSNDLRRDALNLSDWIGETKALTALDLRHNNKIADHFFVIEQMKRILSGQERERPRIFITERAPPSKRIHAADRDATVLESQLAPHATGVLRRRLALAFGETTDPSLVTRAQVMKRLLEHYSLPANYRRIRRVSGTPVRDETCQALLAEMERWVQKDKKRRLDPKEVRERTNIAAAHYMILACKKQFLSTTSKKALQAEAKRQEHIKLWDLAVLALKEVDPTYAAQHLTSIAFTANFTGSAHIDTENVAPFYGLALGDFLSPGGALCVECSAREVAYVDTRHKIARVDGRFPHFVSPYEGNRYSVIFYKTRGEVVPRRTAVFQGESLVPDDPPTFPSSKAGSYYNCYDRATNTYNG